MTIVQETTGYAIGSIPPFHWPPPQFRTFMDAALLHVAKRPVQLLIKRC